jgi:hypothetical protein
VRVRKYRAVTVAWTDILHLTLGTGEAEPWIVTGARFEMDILQPGCLPRSVRSQIIPVVIN